MTVVQVARPSGLLAPFEVPELTIEQSIDRGWELSSVLQLMVPKPEEYLLTYPVDLQGEQAPPRIPWDWSQVVYDYGPFITGLPEV
jgi:hypothetical protein